MIYNFDQAPDRRSTESVKWNYYPRDVLPMWVADMDFVSPEPVIRALQERVAHGVFGYPGDLSGLRDAIVAYLSSSYGWQVAPEDIVFLPGVVPGFNLAARAFIEPGDGILMHTPVYMPFLGVARNVGGLRQETGLARSPSGTYGLDLEAFEGSITDRSRVFLMCNPHNPVGRVYTRAELESLAEICLRHNLLICSDEIHCDLVYPGHPHLPIASLSPEVARRTITLMAPSKTYNIAGLACSFAIIQDPELRGQYCRAEKGLVHGANLLGLVAARAAYREGQEWLTQLLAYVQGNRDLLHDYVNERLPGVQMCLPEGTYLAWLDCRAAGIEGKPCDFFMEKARVAVNDGAAFGAGGEGFVRLNFGCPRPMLVEALERMRAALENLPTAAEPLRKAQ
jgi:cystathionine beta-lyase